MMHLILACLLILSGQGPAQPVSSSIPRGTGGAVSSRASLPDGNPGVPYWATVIPSRGTAPYSCSLYSGSLPSGLSLSNSTCVISGIASAAGTSRFVVQVVDSSGPIKHQRISESLVIANPAAGEPALPKVYGDTTFPDTTGYVVKTVCSTGCNYRKVQGALNAVHRDGGDRKGEVIKLASGMTFAENDTLPACAMASGKWVILRSKTSDANLPAQGVRITPAYSRVLAKIITSSSAPVFQTAMNANHYWFMGVEIGAADGVKRNYGVFVVGNGETSATMLPNNIVLDRCYVHGNSTGNIKRGLAANGAYLAVINSHFENFHAVGQDTQAIAAWNSPGPIKIANNFLEAAGENVMFGGADPKVPSLVNSDIEIRQNHFFKPLTWKSDDPSYAGILWSVKNLLEFKNAQRVLVEGNVLENNWAQAQNGFGILFTPRNQSGGCSWCTVSNVTFRYNLFRHSGSGFNISGSDNEHPSLPSTNINIHDNLMVDINGPAWGGADGRLYQILNGGSSRAEIPPANITINHNTGFQSGNFASVGDNETNPMSGFIFENNIQPHGTYGFFGANVGEGSPALRTYFRTPVFTNNIVMGGVAGSYPRRNFSPSAWSAVRFVRYTGDASGDYHLQATSPYHNAGTDGKDIGVSIDAVNAATEGVLR